MREINFTFLTKPSSKVRGGGEPLTPQTTYFFPFHFPSPLFSINLLCYIYYLLLFNPLPNHFVHLSFHLPSSLSLSLYDRTHQRNVSRLHLKFTRFATRVDPIKLLLSQKLAPLTTFPPCPSFPLCESFDPSPDFAVCMR